jgi:hypothetical protein
LDALRAGIALRASQTNRANGANWTHWSGFTLRALRAGEANRARRTHRAHFALNALRASGALRASQTNRANGAYRPNRASFTLDTLRTGGTLGSLGTLGAHRTNRANRTGWALRTLRAGWTNRANRTYWPSVALNALRSGGTLRAGRTLRSNQPRRAADPVAGVINDLATIDGHGARVDITAADVYRVAGQLRIGLAGDLSARRHFIVSADADAEVEVPAVKQSDREGNDAAQLGLEQTVAHLNIAMSFRPNSRAAGIHRVHAERHLHGAVDVIARRLRGKARLERQRHGRGGLSKETGAQKEQTGSQEE